MDYKKTLNLPRTEFPMKANLTQREPLQLKDWEEEKLYESILDSKKDSTAYILHDGPPYANGKIHIGHALNKILKDFVVKSKSMEGYRTPFVPGWDCHGLPIEHQVLKNLGSKKAEKTPGEIRQLCREYAAKFIDLQREEFKRLGILADWDKPYLTMTPDYEAAIIREFGAVYRTGAVYRAKKPVLWCANDATALAEAEVEYENRTSPSIFVKFPVKKSNGKFSVNPAGGTFFAIWTTTPWTLVANQAIAVHPQLIYRLVRTPAGEIIMAQDLITACMEAFGYKTGEYEITEGSWAGQELEGVVCGHPWLDQESPVILGEHVTLEQGTGCVHTAPGHGQEDYETGQKYGLEVYAPVDSRGRFTTEAGPFAGQKVLEANPPIIQLLKERGNLILEKSIEHSYPHCWRCKKPVIYRATEQWFVSMGKTNLREKALNVVTDKTRVKWIPQWGQDRITGMVETRPDWCISRQRVWGVPIVSFACKKCEEVLCTGDLVDHVADLVENEGGSDIWYSKPAEFFLPPGSSCSKCGGTEFEKLNDILDVWFESGVSHAAVLNKRDDLSWPADLYLEGSDQHRGWFQSSLLTSLLTHNNPPYKAVLTHGFVVDGAGKKMSKSAGNVVSPQEIIQQSGAEILRLWIAATDFREDIKASKEILKHMGEAYRKIRNTSRFLLSNLYDFDPKVNAVSPDKLLKMDRWILVRLQALTDKIRKGYKEFRFHTVFHSLNDFCAVHLSAIYLDIVKDRLYADGADSESRRSAQTAMFEILSALTRLMAPILSFTAEELWKHLPGEGQKETSVHLAAFPDVQDELKEDSFSDYHDLEFILSTRDEVAKALEQKRNEKVIGASGDAKITILAGELYDRLEKYEYLLEAIYRISSLTLEKFDPENPPKAVFISQSQPDFAIRVQKSTDPKCGRCWNFRDSVGKNAQKPDLCARCAQIV